MTSKRLKRHPTIVCYRDVQELIIIKDWFYNFDDSKDNRYRAIQKVKALSSRGKLPHAIESTSLLTSTILTDPSEGGTNNDSNVLQLSYTMALIRFVNGLLDPFQQSNFAIPLHQLAKNLNLPSFFVELRHMGTHELLPNLNILRIASRQALNWLYDNYWNNVEETDDLEDNEDNENERIDINKLTPIIDTCITNLKVFKKIRKQDLNLVIKFGNSSESGIKYWKAIGNLKHLLLEDSGALTKTLIFKNFLIYNYDKLQARESKKFKFNSLLIKLYKPLIEEFGIDFKLQLLFDIFDYLDAYINDDIQSLDMKLGFEFKHDDEIKQIKEWASFLILDLALLRNPTSDVYKFSSYDELVNLIIDKIQKVNMNYQREFLEILQSSLEKLQANSQSKKGLCSKVASLCKQAKVVSLMAPPTLDAILNGTELAESSERPSKKQKTTHTKNVFLFEEHKNWNPLPFGIS